MAATAPTFTLAAGIDPALAAAGDQPEWLSARRAEAFARFQRLGLPRRTQEAWRSTSLASLATLELRMATLGEGETPRGLLDLLAFADSDRIVLVNGRLVPELSNVGTLPAGVVVGDLEELVATVPALLEPVLGRVADDADRPFVALNTAMFQSGVALLIPRGTALARPVHILHLVSAGVGPIVAFPRTLVIAEAGSEATVVETYAGPSGRAYVVVPVTEMALGEGAVVRHVREQREGADAFHVGSQDARQERAAAFASTAVSLGAGLYRLDVNHTLAGEGGDAVLNGLYLVEGAQHCDTHMRVEHAAPHCTSRELYKGVLDGEGSAVFNGLIHVHPGAQKTNAKQSNRNLLLSRRAQANSNPQLEIFADDVKCTHGSTVGQLDEEAIFYLRSRGIGKEAAMSLLTYAFAAEVVEEITVPAVREELKELLFRRLPQGDVVRQAV